ncbi:PHD finger protein 14 [Mortierella alpina]|nr:PHD finger protein 14 [Mortierella alpina]
MAVEQDRQPNTQSRPGRVTMVAHMHAQHQQPYPQQSQQHALKLAPTPPAEHWVQSGSDLTPPPCALPLLSDDHANVLPENSIPPQGFSQRTIRSARHSQSLRPYRPKKTAGDNTATAGDPSSVQGVSSMPCQSTHRPFIIEATAGVTVNFATEAHRTTPHGSNTAHSNSPPAHQHKAGTGNGLPLSYLLNSSEPAGIRPTQPLQTTTVAMKRGAPDEESDTHRPQEREQCSEGRDVSFPRKGVLLERGVPSGSNQDAPTDSSPTETLESKPMDTTLLPHNSGRLAPARPHTAAMAAKGKETTLQPAKKKSKTGLSDRGVNDTASLFQKIFADRDPGKRKIKTKSVHEIPMDMAADEDDSDFEDAKVDSNDEDDADMVMPEDAVSEDDIKPDQHEELGDEQNLMTALWKWASFFDAFSVSILPGAGLPRLTHKDNDPEVCCVCLGRSTEADNVFVYCDTLDCALCIHQACYGVKTLPSESEPWLCDRCKAPPEEVVSCVCCPSKDGAFRRLVPDDPSGGWVHVVCALWLPETTLGDPENVDRISVRDIPEKNWTMACYLCNDPQDAAMGACVQCDAGQCRKSFHITCAQAYSLLETIEDSDMADPYFMYCKQHGSADGQTKLNGWAKWVKQRDLFLKKWQEDQGRKRTQRLIEVQQGVVADDDGGEGLIELFEHSYSQFKLAREQRIARERSELSRQYSIGYSLSTKIDKSRSRLQDISAKAQQAMQERNRIEAQTRNLLSSLLECANYLENVSPEQLQSPLSIDTTLAWYNSLPDTSRWKSNIQDIIETIDIESLGNDNPFAQRAPQGQADSGLDESEGGSRHGRSSKGVYAKLSKKGSKASSGAGKNVKAKKVHPKPTLDNKSQAPVVFTSSRGRLIKRDFSHPDEYFSNAYGGGGEGSSSSHQTYQSNPMSAVKIPRPIVPCSICHQLILPEEKVELERRMHGVLAPMTIKALNRLVTCNTCHRQFHPKCLDPPMARVPPRGYSWNCEDCDSSAESQGSAGELSPTTSSHSHRHQSHSSDLDEALMVLADTAVTFSASNAQYQSEAAAASRGAKRGFATTDHGDDFGMVNSAAAATVQTLSKDKVNRIKRVKSEESVKPKSAKTKAKPSTASSSLESIAPSTKPTKGKGGKFNADLVPAGNGSTGIEKVPVAPIIRGNLRIYPPGPHIAPKSSSAAVLKGAENGGTHPEQGVSKAKATPKTAKTMKSVPPATVKKEAASTPKKKKAASPEAPVKNSGSSKVKSEPAGESAKGKTKANKTAPREATPSATKLASKGSAKSKTTVAAVSTPKEKEKAGARRASVPVVPAVPEPLPAKPKEVIRYTVGEKTVEELTAREDVEIERRDNVKFRKLRGRTLTMPASPQEALLNGAALSAGAMA